MTTNRISVKYTTELQEIAAKELIPQILDITGDMALEILADNFPEKVANLEENEEFLMDQEDEIAVFLTNYLLNFIKKEI